MSRTRWFLPAVALTLAACSADQKVVAPTASASRAVHSATTSSSGRYILSSNSGFKGDLAKTVADLGGKLESVHNGAGIALVTGLSENAARQLAGKGGINDVQADVEITVDQPALIQADISAVSDPAINSQSNPKTAILFSWQWNMRLIQADKAWAMKPARLGSPGVTVAILDSGIDYDNPDLNGLVDLSRSTSFVASDTVITTKYFPARNPISDYNGHGTNVATQVSSKALVFAGVTSKTTLMGVKVLGASGGGSAYGVLLGVLWAADHGADVANMSLGSMQDRRELQGAIGLFNKVFNYAKGKGMLIVVAAGNEGSDLQHNGNTYLAYCDAPHVICVSAVGPRVASELLPLSNGAPNPLMDSRAFYTNYGAQALDIAAPGGNGKPVGTDFEYSTWPWGWDRFSRVYSLCSKTLMVVVVEKETTTDTFPCSMGLFATGAVGTSQASPHVAGLAALLVAEYGRQHPEKIKQMIQRSADDVNPLLGRGRINVFKAVSQ